MHNPGRPRRAKLLNKLQVNVQMRLCGGWAWMCSKKQTGLWTVNWTLDKEQSFSKPPMNLDSLGRPDRPREVFTLPVYSDTVDMKA